VTTVITSPSTEHELTEFIGFEDRVNAGRGAWWPAAVGFHLPTLMGTGPSARGRRLKPLVAPDGDGIVARALAIVDERYIEHWGEQLGHISMFEALPQTTAIVRDLMDEACGWLRSQGMQAARAGFGLSDFPFALDAYDVLPPGLLRQNPAYYHTLLKEAGFESEKGWVDYKIEVTPELVRRWEVALEAAQRSGYRIVPLRDVDEDVRIPVFVETWNDAFSRHWGVTAQDVAEQEETAALLGPLGMYDCSVIAYADDRPVGVVWSVPELASTTAAHAPDRPIRPNELLNFLGIGVRSEARGQGVNMAMASYTYLELVRLGAQYVSYTLVLDDNWPSRRTAEKLGASVCANYMVYRRNFVRA
jgi:hypothetical protein